MCFEQFSFGSIRIDGVTYEHDVVIGLTWRLSASDRFLSNPDFGRRRNEVLLTTGIRVSFAR